MPSPRLLAVTALVALGGLAGLISAGDEGPEPVTAASDVRGGLVSDSPSTGVVAAESRQTGTRAWRFAAARGEAPGLAAYAGAVSAAPGDKVPLYLRGNGSVDVRAFRLGWYGGAGARQVQQASYLATAQTGAPATWQSTGSLDTTGWPEGVYLIRLDLGRASRYLSLTVTGAKSTGTEGRVVVLTSPMTWAAGESTQKHKVTLNRPLATGYGSGGLLAEAGLLAQVERTGTEVVYLTDADLAADPDLLTGATALLVDGDSRFWTAKMRTSVRSAVEAGTNVAYFGAGSATANVVPDATDPRTFTAGGKPVALAARLTGSVATCAAQGRTGLTVSDASWWGFEGAEIEDGEVLKGLVSGDLDRAAAPADVQVVGSTTLACGDTQATSYLERPSGARVFTAGTQAWACTVTGSCTDAQGNALKVDKRAQTVAALVTRNVVEAFATPA
ncbi:hypothetical protein KIH74_01165 [Kineosporia sp. J2-2]|uniref:N,N-dimethylformamidase beta subunit-like C-terminal domain-containing protein n=1 Tax=Kineosporia corallincola TaxID=2835133 RepID=A0ABS5T8V9_9ACTN|nr:N,N-dimethylformamidase beta subunit family domain-containing protein [Kineosporia corallincola]MBT0767512.1 hypothetical protein [Kineosporia corallincola]